MSAYDLNALSGINASSQGLGVISNNLANSQTIGFKSGRAEFADMFSGAQKSPGNGVRVEAITQSFEQGTITATGRELDLALDGEGFFILNDQTGKYGNVYTRNGSFKLDKEGFMTDQAGNKVMGYTLNEALSKELNPVFNTTLSAINLMELNKTPRATDEMSYDINLDGQQKYNVDPFDVNPTATVGSTDNLLKLTKPEAQGVGPFGGFPDFSTQKTIHDTLGGEHRLTSNFYKRDVVEAVVGLSSFQESYNGYSNALVNYNNAVDDGLVGADLLPYETALETNYDALQQKIADDFALADPLGSGVALTGAIGDPAATIAGNAAAIYADYQTEIQFRKDNNLNDLGEKYTSWIVQYTVEDFDIDTGEWVTSGHRYDQDNGVETNEAGIIFELRFDTNGNLLQTRQPADRSDPSGENLGLDMEPTSRELSPLDWVEVSGRKGKLDWVIDSPKTGATDPLGAQDPTTLQLAIDVDFSDMTMFSGDYTLRGVTQNGYRIGDLVGLTTGRDGVIEARYSNGRSIPVAQLAVANFNDLNALEKLGGQMYAESFGSGPAMIGKAQSGGMGTINAGSLEYSNVDTAGELVKMIQTQRTYQASAQVLSTSQELTRTILNL
ncbi:MAG: flagellar hook protein FlgE [Thiomicrospira sp.]|uniref:flagellar hook protein FlgE n=1 Tax=Thiomicrospira sp. TaxID=935 RepID=UPI001A07EA13|nr:flagellar hook protein FlgE [Thiomicrospira sp.]MBE0494219.1 flagellar hook protein FlgE [Thiomicrospira sp.]